MINKLNRILFFSFRMRCCIVNMIVLRPCSCACVFSWYRRNKQKKTKNVSFNVQMCVCVCLNSTVTVNAIEPQTKEAANITGHTFRIYKYSISSTIIVITGNNKNKRRRPPMAHNNNNSNNKKRARLPTMSLHFVYLVSRSVKRKIKK